MFRVIDSINGRIKPIRFFFLVWKTALRILAFYNYKKLGSNKLKIIKVTMAIH